MQALQFFRNLLRHLLDSGVQLVVFFEQEFEFTGHVVQLYLHLSNLLVFFNQFGF